MKHLVKLNTPGLVPDNQKKEEESKEQYSVILFNRQIGIPENELWPGQDRVCHIYGLVVDDEIVEKLLETCNTYLGYLAMCEEAYASPSRQTLSGYSIKNDYYWEKDGEDYYVGSEAFQTECLLYRQKYNLKHRAAVVRMPKEELEKGVRDGLILSKSLYDSLIEKMALANDENWMSEIN